MLNGSSFPRTLLSERTWERLQLRYEYQRDTRPPSILSQRSFDGGAPCFSAHVESDPYITSFQKVPCKFPRTI